MVKRRNILIGAGFVPLLASCATQEQDITDKTTNVIDEQLSEKDENYSTDYNNAQRSILSNGALVFGPDNFFASKTIVLDLGSEKSKIFYNKYKDRIREAYDDKEHGIGITLIDSSDFSTDAHTQEFSLSASSVAISIYQNSKESLWDYISNVYEHLETNDTNHTDEVELPLLLKVAESIGFFNSEFIASTIETTNMLVRNMAMTAEGFAEDAPVLLNNRERWEGNMDNSKEIIEWLQNKH